MGVAALALLRYEEERAKGVPAFESVNLAVVIDLRIIGCYMPVGDDVDAVVAQAALDCPVDTTGCYGYINGCMRWQSEMHWGEVARVVLTSNGRLGDGDAGGVGERGDTQLAVAVLLTVIVSIHKIWNGKPEVSIYLRRDENGADQ